MTSTMNRRTRWAKGVIWVSALTMLYSFVRIDMMLSAQYDYRVSNKIIYPLTIADQQTIALYCVTMLVLYFVIEIAAKVGKIEL